MESKKHHFSWELRIQFSFSPLYPPLFIFLPSSPSQQWSYRSFPVVLVSAARADPRFSHASWSHGWALTSPVGWSGPPSVWWCPAERKTLLETGPLQPVLRHHLKWHPSERGRYHLPTAPRRKYCLLPSLRKKRGGRISRSLHNLQKPLRECTNQTITFSEQFRTSPEEHELTWRRSSVPDKGKAVRGSGSNEHLFHDAVGRRKQTEVIFDSAPEVGQKSALLIQRLLTQTAWWEIERYAKAFVYFAYWILGLPPSLRTAHASLKLLMFSKLHHGLLRIIA